MGLVRMMADMVELPRNPLDFKIDALSPAALRRLQTWDGVSHTYRELTPWLRELMEAGFAANAGGSYGINGVQLEWKVALTFDGKNAQLRVNSGIYQHHKGIYERRAERDRAAEAMAGG